MRLAGRDGWEGFTSRLTPVNVIGAMLAVCLTVLFYHAFAAAGTEQRLDRQQQRSEKNTARIQHITEQNQDITCSIAKLVAFVPALQFEGEPVENFIGWIESRKALLEEAEEDFGCDPEVEAILRDRVALDQKLLAELRPRP